MLFAVLCLALTSVIGPSAPVDRQASPPRAGVSGRRLTEDGQPLVSGTVVMSRQHGGQPGEQVASEATVLPDGSFTFHQVPPGDYVIRARARSEGGSVPLFATFALPVRAREVQHVELTLRPGAVVQGEVSLDARHGNTPPLPTTLRIRAPLPDGSSFGDAGGADVRRDGTFTLQGVMAGTHVLAVQGLVFPWRISEARILGQDAAERAFDVEARQHVQGVRVVVSDIAAGVAGTVRVPPDTPLDDVLVVAFPDDPLRRALPLRFVRVGRPARNGSYRIVDLAAERYRVIAAVKATEQDALNPDILDRWMAAGTPVTLVATRVSTVPLTATRPPAPAPVP